jgi:hypothetical protein
VFSYLRIIYYLMRYTMLYLGLSSVKISPMGGEGGRQSRDKWRSSLHEGTRDGALGQPMARCQESKACHTHGLRAKLGRTHVWVVMYQFEFNRVSLGQTRLVLGQVYVQKAPTPLSTPGAFNQNPNYQTEPSVPLKSYSPIHINLEFYLLKFECCLLFHWELVDCNYCFVVDGYVCKRVKLQISKGLRAVALAAGISQRVFSDTRIISIAIYTALTDKIGTPLIILVSDSSVSSMSIHNPSP